MIARIQHTRAPLSTRVVAPRRFSLLLAVLSTVLSVNLLETTATASPAAVVVAEDWTVDFKPGPLRLYQDPIDDRMYWYFTYRVTNSTGQDRMFSPWLPGSAVSTFARDRLLHCCRASSLIRSLRS